MDHFTARTRSYGYTNHVPKRDPLSWAYTERVDGKPVYFDEDGRVRPQA